jgi:hypothetical protein
LQSRQEALFGNNRLFIKQFRTKTCTCDTIRQYLDKLYSQHDVKIGMLIVDYLDLMKSSRPREKDYLEAVDICEDLRGVSSKEEYAVPIWTACRTTREAVGKKRINMAHMSKAFERIGVADAVLANCMTEEEKLNREMRIVPVAMRNDGSDQTVQCAVDYERMKIVSVGLAETDLEDENEDKPRRKYDSDDKPTKRRETKDSSEDPELSDRRKFMRGAKRGKGDDVVALG